MKRVMLIITAVLTVAFFSSCHKDPQPNSGCPVVLTNEVTEIGTHSAVCCSTVTDQGGSSILVRGICWGLSPNPTTNDSFENSDVYIKTDSVQGVGDFKVRMKGLAANATYYVRAYATNSKGISYGEEVSFTTQSYGDDVPEGGVNALFSVDENGGKVWFSKGNLQFQPFTGTWRFAEDQWNVCDTTLDEHVTPDYMEGSSAWIELFGWGTSGYDHGAVNYQPWSTSTIPSNYIAYGLAESNLCDQTGKADWGYNAISNGGNTENSGWRTLTKDEWNYLLMERPNASRLFGQGQVAGMNGLIILPDDWMLPNGFSFVTGLSQWKNSYTAEQWRKMELAGAVFLPAVGMREGTKLLHMMGSGNYWSSTCLIGSGMQYGTYALYFGYETMASDNVVDRCQGFSVRLVRAFE